VRRVRLLPLAMLVLFLAEVVAFIGLGELIGYPAAVLLVLMVSLLGLVLLRREGLRAWYGFRRAAEAGQPPGRQVTDGVVGLGGAALLAAPGLITGAAGLVLLTPPVRHLARGRVQARAERRMSSGEAGQMFGPRRVYVEQEGQPYRSDEPDTDVVEGEVVDPPSRPEAG
jgi:UPF0716 protein FxsA